MRFRSRLVFGAPSALLLIAASILLLASACEHSSDDPLETAGDLAPSDVAVQPYGIFADGFGSWVNQLPTMGMLAPGDTQQSAAYGYGYAPRGSHSDVSSDKVSQKFVWSSSDSAVASISATGLITARTAGTATIFARSARDASRVGSVKLSVLDQALRFTAVSTGTQACAIDSSGGAWCWGGTTSGRAVYGLSDRAVRVPDGGAFTSLSVGGIPLSMAGDISVACGVTSASKLFCWGSNGYRQLGNPSPPTDGTPALVAGSYVQVAVGTQTACALGAEGDVYCWGYAAGGIGTGSTLTTPVTTPTAVVGGLRFRSVAVGNARACGVAEDAIAYCWGSSPVAVPGSVKFSQVAVGPTFTCGISTSHALYCWGTASSPTQVASSVSFGSVSASATQNSACALASDGRAYCFSVAGDGTVSPLGIQIVQKPSTFTSLSVGSTIACGMSNGKTYCWRGVTSLGTSVATIAKGQGVSP